MFLWHQIYPEILQNVYLDCISPHTYTISLLVTPLRYESFGLYTFNVFSLWVFRLREYKYNHFDILFYNLAESQLSTRDGIELVNGYRIYGLQNMPWRFQKHTTHLTNLLTEFRNDPLIRLYADNLFQKRVVGEEQHLHLE